MLSFGAVGQFALGQFDEAASEIEANLSVTEADDTLVASATAPPLAVVTGGGKRKRGAKRPIAFLPIPRKGHLPEAYLPKVEPEFVVAAREPELAAPVADWPVSLPITDEDRARARELADRLTPKHPVPEPRPVEKPKSRARLRVREEGDALSAHAMHDRQARAAITEQPDRGRADASVEIAARSRTVEQDDRVEATASWSDDDMAFGLLNAAIDEDRRVAIAALTKLRDAVALQEKIKPLGLTSAEIRKFKALIQLVGEDKVTPQRLDEMEAGLKEPPKAAARPTPRQKPVLQPVPPRRPSVPPPPWVH